MVDGGENNPETRTVTPRTRRSFLNYLLGATVIAGIGGVINTLVRFLWPTEEITGGGKAAGTTSLPLSEIPVGGAKTVRHKGKPYIVVRQVAKLYAVNAICTHLGCIVYWDPSIKQLACPCHTAFFDLNGNIITGPAPTPLPTAEVKVAGDQIVIS
ncbi:MAG: ubiquinol-cytochrome c reductase iron-sulfur subunit [Thermodesulfobacteriota bacterium]